MGVTAFSGPLIIHGPGATTGAANQATIPVSPDNGPSPIYGGITLFDPRFTYKGGGGTEANALLAIGVGLNQGYCTVDQVPSAVTTQNIVAAAATTSGTNLTLVSASGAGITLLSSALTIPQTGNVVPSGALAIDLAPGLVYFGNNKSTAVADPTKNVARCLTVTASSGAVGGAILLKGADLYGYPMTQLLTVASSPSGSTGTTTKKAFKFLYSATPQFTDTKSYSIGTSDTYGFPTAVNEFPFVLVAWNGSFVVSTAGYTAAISSTATNTTGDTRGTYALQGSTSDGTKALQMFNGIQAANVNSIAGIFGVTPA